MKSFLRIALFTFLALLGSSAKAQINTFCPVNLNCIITGNWQFTGTLTPASLQSVVYANSQTGGDCGAKINAASTLLAGPGEIWVNKACGLTWTTAVVLSTNYQTIRFIQGGTYTSSVANTISGVGSGIESALCAENDPVIPGHNCAVLFQQASFTNLSSPLWTLSGPQSYIHNITIDGNKANNGSFATVGIKMTGNRSELTEVDVLNFHGDGIQTIGTPAPPGTSGCDGVTYCIAEGANLNHIQSSLNDGNGWTVTNQTDVFAHFSKFEDNGGWGLKVTNGTVFADTASDFGGNTLGGADAITTSNNFNVWSALIFNGITAGNNAGPAIFQSGWNGSTIANGPTSIQNSSLVNGAGLGTTQDLVHLEDVSGVMFSGNTVQCVGSSQCRYGVSLINNSGSASSGNVTNNIVTGSFTNTNSAVYGNNIPLNLGTTANVQFALNNENGSSYSSITHIRLLNGNPLFCTNSSGTIEPCFYMNSGNSLEIYGDPTANRIDLSPDGGTTLLGFTSTQSLFPNAWALTWKNNSSAFSGTLTLNSSNDFVLNNGNSGRQINFQILGTTVMSLSATGCTGIACGNVFSASLTTTAATSDAATVTGATSSSHCSLAAKNASAATNITTSYISATASNSVTVTHTATSGMTYDILCSAN
jgi:hypothetical protein